MIQPLTKTELFHNWAFLFRQQCAQSPKVSSLDLDFLEKFIEVTFWSKDRGMASFPENISFGYAMEKIVTTAIDELQSYGGVVIDAEQKIELLHLSAATLERVAEAQSEVQAKSSEPWRYQKKFDQKKKLSVEVVIPESLPDKFKK